MGKSARLVEIVVNEENDETLTVRESDEIIAVFGLASRYVGRLIAAGFRLQTSLLNVSDERAREKAIVNLLRTYERIYELPFNALSHCTLRLPFLGIEVRFEGGRPTVHHASTPIPPPTRIKPHVTATMISMERMTQLRKYLVLGAKGVVRTFGYLPSWLRVLSLIEGELPLFNPTLIATSLLNTVSDVSIVKHIIDTIAEEDLGVMVRAKGDTWWWRKNGGSVLVPLLSAPTDVLNLLPVVAWTLLSPPSLLVVESPFAGLSTLSSKLTMIAHSIAHASSGFPFIAIAPTIEELAIYNEMGMRSVRVIVLEKERVLEARLDEIGAEELARLVKTFRLSE